MIGRRGCGSESVVGVAGPDGDGNRDRNGTEMGIEGGGNIVGT